ncbi:hypothetical protein C8P66_12544 [Humitalea rosea]|uniref:Glycosyl transferase family 2 n=1 Tax=Humitalea rosea TaxID=990373 RepID=A0A2W7HZV9_9PROT|nr:hypothetical protein [Humitalea rosea]PZW40076.1 hypothetical protein C8P66_12544 [Humitalea rosea]
MTPPPIAIMSCNRPVMLYRVLESLRSQIAPVDAARVGLFQDVAPEEAVEDVAAASACIAIFRSLFPEGSVHATEVNLGTALNFDRAERHLFQTLDAEVGYILEDDMVLSPHYLTAMDMMAAFALSEERVGTFAAYGMHRATPEAMGQQRRRITQMHHSWAFGLTRRHWLRCREVVEGYLALIGPGNYRKRPHGAIREHFAALGVPSLATSQDAAKNVACHLAGAARITCIPAYGHYIGSQGEHFTEDAYRKGGYGATRLFEEAPEGFDFPSSQQLAAMACRDAVTTALSAVPAPAKAPVAGPVLAVPAPALA